MIDLKVGCAGAFKRHKCLYCSTSSCLPSSTHHLPLTSLNALLYLCGEPKGTWLAGLDWIGLDCPALPECPLKCYLGAEISLSVFSRGTRGVWTFSLLLVGFFPMWLLLWVQSFFLPHDLTWPAWVGSQSDEWWMCCKPKTNWPFRNCPSHCQASQCFPIITKTDH